MKNHKEDGTDIAVLPFLFSTAVELAASSLSDSDSDSEPSASADSESLEESRWLATSLPFEDLLRGADALELWVDDFSLVFRGGAGSSSLSLSLSLSLSEADSSSELALFFAAAGCGFFVARLALRVRVGFLLGPSRLGIAALGGFGLLLRV